MTPWNGICKYCRKPVVPPVRYAKVHKAHSRCYLDHQITLRKFRMKALYAGELAKVTKQCAGGCGKFLHPHSHKLCTDCVAVRIKDASAIKRMVGSPKRKRQAMGKPISCMKCGCQREIIIRATIRSQHKEGLRMEVQTKWLCLMCLMPCFTAYNQYDYIIMKKRAMQLVE